MNEEGGASTGPLVWARPDHVGMVVADLAAQRRWYGKLFGLVEITGHQPVPGTRTSLMRAPSGLQLELVECVGSRREHDFKDAHEAALVQGYGHWAIEVDDVGEAFNRLLDAGATPAKPPGPGPSGSKFAYVKDPEGNLIELIEQGSKPPQS